MSSQWKSIVFWVGAVLVIVLATLFYQPAAAKTGALLVWTRNRVYVMDIDTLDLQRVGPAILDQSIVPSPGCFAHVDAPCWVLVDDNLYEIDLSIGGNHQLSGRLPAGDNFYWPDDSQPVWSPDGVTIAYSIVNDDTDQAELWIYDLKTNTVKKLPESNIDPAIAIAWTESCAGGLTADGCKLGYRKMPSDADLEQTKLIGYAPATGSIREWSISSEPIYELRWAPDGMLLYSRPKRHFFRADNAESIFQLPEGSKLANISPDARHAIYYQPFNLEGCDTPDSEGSCLHLGVWLVQASDESKDEAEDRRLIYSVNLDDESRTGGLNFVPVWRPDGNAFVFFQDGELIHYDLEKQEGTIWYKPVRGKLRSVPVFSPDGETVAFIDNQGQGYSEYRLVIINPRLQPLEEVLQEDNFRILGWLPN